MNLLPLSGSLCSLGVNRSVVASGPNLHSAIIAAYGLDLPITGTFLGKNTYGTEAVPDYGYVYWDGARWQAVKYDFEGSEEAFSSATITDVLYPFGLTWNNFQVTEGT